MTLLDGILIEEFDCWPEDRKKRKEHHQDKDDDQKVLDWSKTLERTVFHRQTPLLVECIYIIIKN
jgi:hypothetical protein